MAHGVKLDSLSLEDLKALINDAHAALAARIEVKRQELKKQIEELDAMSALAKPAALSKKTNPVKVTHRGPNGETWTSRGQKPKWLQALIDKGHDESEFRVKE